MHWYRIGSVSADPQILRYRIGSEKMVSLHPYLKLKKLRNMKLGKGAHIQLHNREK